MSELIYKIRQSKRATELALQCLANFNDSSEMLSGESVSSIPIYTTKPSRPAAFSSAERIGWRFVSTTLSEDGAIENAAMVDIDRRSGGRPAIAQVTPDGRSFYARIIQTIEEIVELSESTREESFGPFRPRLLVLPQFRWEAIWYCSVQRTGRSLFRLPSSERLVDAVKCAETINFIKARHKLSN